MTEHAVVIAGGGPTGLTLAGELALAGVDVAIIERRVDAALTGMRAGGLLARTIELFDQRGIAGRFLAEGKTAQVMRFANVTLDLSDFPTRHPYGLGLWQQHIERILGAWVAELGVRIYRGQQVTGLTQDASGVTVAIAGGAALRARYLVGCDGGRSVVRKAAGIAFPGWDASTCSLIAEVQMTVTPPWGLHHDVIGRHAFSRLDDGTTVRVLVTERQLGPTGEATLHELRDALIAAYGTDFGAHSPSSISRFSDATRQAAAYRNGRVLLAGDAAHVHAPDGGQGLNLGVQDAVNLGWKLARVIRGACSDALLDTYHAERHPVAAHALRLSMALVALRRQSDERMTALNETIATMLEFGKPRRRLAADFSGLGVHYALGAGHPLRGRRMPDLELITAQGPLRVFTLLRRARPVLLNLAASPLTPAPWADRVQFVQAAYDGPWLLPVLGPVAPPAAVLIRPDGYVAWVGESPATAAPGNAQLPTGLAEALTTWFGPPADSLAGRN